MTHAYSEAVVSLLASGQPVDEVLPRLRTLLEKRGHERLYPRILATVTARLTDTKDAPVVKVSKASDAKAALVTALLTELGAAAAAPVVVVDETLVGGAVVRVGHQEIDASYKTLLRRLYQTVITK